MANISVQRAEPTRFVLEGVPRVGFYQGGVRCPEDICFPAVMRACMEYLGDADLGCKHAGALKPGCKVSCTYAYMLGVSGVASFLSWRPGWHMDNFEIRYMSDDPAAPFERAFEAAGYAPEYAGKGQGHDEAHFRSRLIGSLRDRGRPAIAFGIVGPPEACIVTGYDEGGDVLIGWNFFQDDPGSNAGVGSEPNGYFRKRDWFKACEGLLLFGEKREKPKLGEIYRKALQWNVQVARTPRVTAYGHERHTGLAAYSAWAEQLTHDEDFPADDEALLREHHQVHDQMVGLVAEARWYGSQFLVGMTEIVDAGVHRDAIEDLYHAAAYCAGEHELMWQVWDLAGGIGNPEAWRKMADPAVRRRMAPIILESGGKCARAADHMERALGKWR